MRKIKYYLYPVLLVICLYSCSSTDDDEQEPQPPIEIPDADELASIGVGLVDIIHLMMKQVMTALPIIMMQY